jgi:ribonuclease E
MSNKMLIDANHDEETRVIVLNKEGKIQEFDIEARDRRQIRGNIYLAKVTRVEPSLQAAFVEYGGNRHGFLAFSEIHPDYYQIPKSEREKLLDEASNQQEDPDTENEKIEDIDDSENHSNDEGMQDQENIIDEIPKKTNNFRKRYKIQEVIKKRQIILVQVTKEERGNKGAAITTYISLAGRYCVLMPNTARGGGISRKISDHKTRSKLKESIGDLSIPNGMGVIIRTAGANRTKTEIKRDFEYLTKLWQTIRNLTLNSSAPALIYEEGSLVKRSIRDLYNKDIEDIIISGDNAFNEAKNFMKMLIPSHIKFIKKYKDPTPLFIKHNAEKELNNMFLTNVRLPSGGYIVINQTEALVAIDVNSGRSIREHNIEDTAHRTNLEASDEIARQLRLRDLAGLVVIDFIDMEERRNNRSVEKRIKDALRNDRARIQVGHISQFGLLEMSRQRMRSSVMESSMRACDYCKGIGRVNSVSSQSIQVLRAIEEDIIQNGRTNMNLSVGNDLSDYLLNSKRKDIFNIEQKYEIRINVEISNKINEDIYLIEHIKLDNDLIEKNQSSAISIDTVYENESDSDDIPDKNSKIKKNNKANPNPNSRNHKRNLKPKLASPKIEKIKQETDKIKDKDEEQPKKKYNTRKKTETKKPDVIEKIASNVSLDKKAPLKNKASKGIKEVKKNDPIKKKPDVKKIQSKDLPKEDQKTGWWDD